MTRPIARRARPVVATALLLVACAAPPERADDAAGDLVSERIGAAPRDGAAADERVAALLAAPLDERGAVEVALARSRAVRAALHHAVAAAHAARAEAAPGNPLVDVLVRWPHGGGGPLVDAGASFALLDVLRLPARCTAADVAVRAAALDAADAILMRVTEVRAAWGDAAAAGERELLAADAVEAADVAAELASRQYEAGTLGRLDLLRHQAFAAEERAELERARGATAVARERLVRALGLHGAEAAVEVTPGVPDVAAETRDAAALERRAVERRLDVERARVALVLARLAAGAADDARPLPDLEAGVSFERDTDGSRSTGPSFGFELPLSPRGAHEAASAAAAEREAAARLYDVAVVARSEVREARAELDAALRVVARLRDELVPLRADAVAEAQLHYNGMLVGVYDVLAERRDAMRARAALVDARQAAWHARVRLDAALGGEPLRGADVRDVTPPAAAPPAEPPPAHVHSGHGGH